MKNSLILVIFVFLMLWVQSRHYALIGDAGAGKSTTINSLCGVGAKTGRFSSTTNETTQYDCSSSRIQTLRGDHFIDTAGIYDTNGRTDVEILEEIEGYYLRYINTTETPYIDGFIIPVNSRSNRVQLTNTLSRFGASFSKSIFKSLVVLINWDSSDSIDHIQDLEEDVKERVITVARTAFPDERVRIPILVYDAKNPTPEQRERLTTALTKIAPYYLKDLGEKKKIIAKYYEEILARPENYRNETEKIVEEQKREVEKQILKKVPLNVTETKVDGCLVQIKLDAFEACIPKEVIEKKIIMVDEVVSLKETKMLPTVTEKVKQVLKNELETYWLLAVKKYEEENRKKFIKRK